jgi:hypothetical protein
MPSAIPKDTKPKAKLLPATAVAAALGKAPHKVVGEPRPLIHGVDQVAGERIGPISMRRTLRPGAGRPSALVPPPNRNPGSRIPVAGI